MSTKVQPYESASAKFWRYLAWGFSIKPDGVVFNPADGSEVDHIHLEDVDFHGATAA